MKKTFSLLISLVISFSLIFSVLVKADLIMGDAGTKVEDEEETTASIDDNYIKKHFNLYVNEEIYQDGIGLTADPFTQYYVYGCTITSPVNGIMSDSYGKFELGDISCFAAKEEFEGILTEVKNAENEKTTIIEGGRNALLIASQNLPEYWKNEGTSEEEFPKMSAVIEAHNSAFKTNVSIYETTINNLAEFAYNDHIMGSVIVIKSTNADISLDNCRMAVSPESNGYLIHSVPANFSENVNSVPDGEKYPGINVLMNNMSVVGNIAHEDYQRDFVFTLKTTTFEGSINEYSFENWKTKASEEGFAELVFDEKYETHHGIEVVLEESSVWKVTDMSVLSRLKITEGSVVNGVIYLDGKEVANEPAEYIGNVVVVPVGMNPFEEETTTAEEHVHSWTESEKVNPACLMDGYIKYTCSGCTETKTEVLPATGHNFVRDNGGSPADCENDGIKPYFCTECSATYDEILPKMGHDMQFSYSVTKTCLMSGYDVYKCSRCPYEEMKNFEEATGHELTFWYYQSSGCETQGGDWYFCLNCPYEEFQADDPPKGHSWVLDYHWYATCITDEYDHYLCERCTADYYDYNGEKASGHNMDGVMPDYNEGLESVYHINYCTKCGTPFYYTATIHDGHDPCICGWSGPVG